MGRVYEAFDPALDRRVAIKVLRSESACSFRRLVREAKTLARLSHPNVVTIYEVGSERGEVFLAMEYVAGVTFRGWLDDARQRSPFPAELCFDLLLQAGRGLVAAHQAGIVHRDFKPGNILVGDDDRARVADFGLAKFAADPMDARLDALWGEQIKAENGLEAYATKSGAIAGTPRYMAPEQAEGRKVDARADQYAFCVVAWEALFGERPDPLGSSGPTIESDAMPTAELRRLLEQGLADDPELRHPSVADLVQRLEHAWRPQPRPKRLWRVASLVVLGGGALSLAGASLSREVIERGCRSSGDAIFSVWNPQTMHAIGEAFVDADPSFGEEAWPKVQARLDEFAQGWAAERREACIDAEIEHTRPLYVTEAAMVCLDAQQREFTALLAAFESATRADVQQSVGAAYALGPLELCSDWAWLRLGADEVHADSSSAHTMIGRELAMARAAYWVGRRVEARDHAARAVEAAMRTNDPSLQLRARYQAVFLQLATDDDVESVARMENLYYEAGAGGEELVAVRAAIDLIRDTGVIRGRAEQSEHWFQTAMMHIRRLDLEGSLLHASALSYLGVAQDLAGDIPRAKAAMSKALAILERYHGPSHPEVAAALVVSGILATRDGSYDEAFDHYDRALSIYRRFYPDHHPSVTTCRINIAEALQDLGHLERALEIQAEILASYGGDASSSDVALAHYNLGITSKSLGDFEAAESHLLAALRIRTAIFGPRHQDVAASLNSVGGLALERRDYAEAIRRFSEAEAAFEASLGETHGFTAYPLGNRAEAELRSGNADAALELATKAMHIAEQAFGGVHPMVAAAEDTRARAHLRRGDRDLAATSARRALQIRQRAYGSDHPDVGASLHVMGEVLEAQGDVAGAIAAFEQAIDVLTPAPQSKPELAAVSFALARLLDDRTRDPPRASKLASAARRLYEQTNRTSGPEYAAVQSWLARH